jgi:hypothetical protein
MEVDAIVRWVMKLNTNGRGFWIDEFRSASIPPSSSEGLQARFIWFPCRGYGYSLSLIPEFGTF